MAASLLSIPMKHSLPLAGVVVAILCVQYGVQSLLKPMLQIETVRMAGEEKVERATALVSQVTMVSNILGPMVGTAVYGCLALILFAQPRRWRLRFQLSCLGSHSSKMPHLKRGETARLVRHAEMIFGSRFGICCKCIIGRRDFACGRFEPCVGWPNDWRSHYCYKASRHAIVLRWDS